MSLIQDFVYFSFRFYSQVNIITLKELTELNTYLANCSYVQGYTPTVADRVVLESIKGIKWPEDMHHLSRWYNHMESFALSELTAGPALPSKLKGLITTNDHGEDLNHKVRKST